jgi:four helix bundle protein
MRHADTHIYRRSLELIDLTKEVLAELPNGYGFLSDQLRRAASSVTLNFAEGCGKQSGRDRRRYFLTSRGSAYEVAAALDVGARFGVVGTECCRRGQTLCDELAAMLTCFR